MAPCSIHLDTFEILEYIQEPEYRRDSRDSRASHSRSRLGCKYSRPFDTSDVRSHSSTLLVQIRASIYPRKFAKSVHHRCVVYPCIEVNRRNTGSSYATNNSLIPLLEAWATRHGPSRNEIFLFPRSPLPVAKCNTDVTSADRKQVLLLHTGASAAN